jgi:photosystem II stability/assembly factor-like uncharacterized protein
MTQPPSLRLANSLLAAAILAGAASLPAQSALPHDSTLVRSLGFRSIGPALMSGRITDIAVVENRARAGRPGNIVYVGAATGGVWKTTNAGVTWTAIFDSVRTGGVGAVEVAPSNAEIVWVGTGEASNMRSSSWGTGVYKSIDGGRTWTGPMLPKSQHIGRIVIDPRDPNIVYVAALGPLWAPGGERGLYKTTDGGKTWTNTKEISRFTGFTDVAMDPSNPDVLYAASFMRERREYSFLPAGPESGLWKTTDGAKTWTKLATGLPTGDIGRIGISICTSKPTTVYSIFHARGNTGGIYRSDDAGANWRQVSQVNPTAWFYSFVKCDPNDPEHVIRLNAASQESVDGGRTWTGYAGGGVHSDHHELWIDPDHPEFQILGTDGGLYTTYDRGRTWDHNQALPLSQFYDIFVDDALPYYNVCGGLQDNGSWCGPNRSRNSFGPTNADWYRTGGGDGFYVVPDPFDGNIVYAESQNGNISRYDARTGQSRGIRPTVKPGEKALRFNWNAPILPSRHERGVVLMASNFVHRSTDRGDSWVKISGDLTRAIDRNTLPMRGVVPDSGTLGRHEGTADFGNITTLEESPLKSGLLAAGTDDGVIQVTRDGGKTWTKVDKFAGVPDTTFVSRVIWSRAAEGTLYASFDGHRSNDFKPYVLKSTDYGRTWTSVTGNLPDGGSIQVVREHHGTPQLLFVGTEFGVFFSTEGGNSWTQLKGGIPGVPVHDIKIQERANDLVVGTHGRGVFILDDLTPLEKLAEAKKTNAVFMFTIADALLYAPNTSRNSGMGTRGFAGQNPPVGPKIAFVSRGVPADAKAKIDIVDAAGTVVRELPMSKSAGLHRISWDMRVGPPLTGPVPPEAAPGGRGGRGGGTGTGTGTGGRASGAGGDSTAAPAQGGGGGGRGGNEASTFTALPGEYTARITVTPVSGAATVASQKFVITKDPNVALTVAELRALHQYRLNVASFQRSLRERVAQADSAQRRFADIKRVADSAAARLSDETKKELAAIDKEFQDVAREIGGGAGAGGRGGRGGGAGGAGGRGGAAGGAGGGAAGGAAAIDEQTPPPEPTTFTIQQRAGTIADVLNSWFNPTPAQIENVKTLPTDLQKQVDRVQKLVNERIPALQRAMTAAGVSTQMR